MSTAIIPARFCGPPNIGHGGYVAALLAEGVLGARADAVQVTLRKPTPLDIELKLAELDGGKRALIAPSADGELVTAELEPAQLVLDIPAPPSLEHARAAEAGSPAHYNENGVHPRCFGCGKLREPGDALRLFVGPCGHGHPGVAGVFRPGAAFGDGRGHAQQAFAIAALDCPGAFAFMVDGKRAGLLGRFTVQLFAPAPADDDLIVTGWRIGEEGRKLFAGTALHTADGRLLAAARATWFSFG